MRVIKLGLISVIFLFLLITGISLFFPSRVRISKAIQINSTREMVMAQIGDPVNWKNWYPGDSTKELLYVNGEIKGLASGKGSGQGIMITEKNDSSVRAANVGPGSKNIEMGWNIFLGNSVQPVTVQWYMDFHLRWYPWEKFSSLLLEKSYGSKMEKGLSDLKKIVER